MFSVLFAPILSKWNPGVARGREANAGLGRDLWAILQMRNAGGPGIDKQQVVHLPLVARITVTFLYLHLHLLHKGPRGRQFWPFKQFAFQSLCQTFLFNCLWASRNKCYTTEVLQLVLMWIKSRSLNPLGNIPIHSFVYHPGPSITLAAAPSQRRCGEMIMFYVSN